eukprot:7210675-Pyramimonas_sp.AAC.1
MRTPPLRPSVKLPMGPQSAVQREGTACERSNWGLRWNSLWGHETLYWVGEAHANAAIGAFGGAAYRATRS